MEYAALKGTAGSDVTLQQLGFQTDFAVYLQIRQTWLAFMIILAIVEVIIILLLIFLRKRILIAIALIKEASRAIGHVIFLPFFNPLLTFASWPWSCLNGPQCFFFLFTKLSPTGDPLGLTAAPHPSILSSSIIRVLLIIWTHRCKGSSLPSFSSLGMVRPSRVRPPNLHLTTGSPHTDRGGVCLPPIAHRLLHVSRHVCGHTLPSWRTWRGTTAAPSGPT
ncbi:hypothetical protein FQN60_004290 [Etheostoma spectabile]|uniref:Choline transporter-like protein n=1 Tax=Etheostoma spectabile TaxID=54343 RepID=A0A5J5CY36_9PERO|nr:hypothetical protein FQN60_004290 [Etheostoma spectabile]